MFIWKLQIPNTGVSEVGREACQIAQAAFDAWIEKQPKVYATKGHDFGDFSDWSKHRTAQTGIFQEYSARLVMIEETKKCEHRPGFIIIDHPKCSNAKFLRIEIKKESFMCDLCGKRLKPSGWVESE